MKRLTPLALSGLLAAAAALPETLERVIVKVNGDIVTQSEFQSRQLAAIQAARVPPDGIEAFLRENNGRILQEAIDDLLLVQRAEELGIRLRPETLAGFIEGIKKENNIPSDEALLEQLRREGMSLDDLKRNIQRSVLRRETVQRDMAARVVLTEESVRADYDARVAEYTKPESIKLQQILVPDEAVAAQLVSRARAGEDFATLARAFSEDATRAAGGELGSFARGELSPSLDQAAFALAVGEVSEPIATPDGFRILRVQERTPASVTGFEQARAEIRERLGRERWAKEYDAYIGELRAASQRGIDLRVREVPLQVAVPPEPSTLLEPPEELGPRPAPAAPAAPISPDAELVATPQERPEHVVPPAQREKGDSPQPEPSPSPTPPPGR
jgi:parvulin-like peptidyl-prolyl isomerase